VITATDLLTAQRPDGRWGDDVEHPFWWTTLYTLLWLRDLAVDPTAPHVRAAIARVRTHVTWGPEFGDSPFFDGEVEPCINGRVVALGAYFGELRPALVQRLLGEQLADGGWNCEAERGSVRSSFHTTLCVLEGLRGLDYLRAAGVTPDARCAEAIAIVRARQQTDGQWLRDRRHRDSLYDDLAGEVGAPSAWITERARRVLRWADQHA
jgi:hypothetical protein